MVSDTQTLVQYLGNGGNVDPYPIPFYFAENSWIKVMVEDTVTGIVTPLVEDAGTFPHEPNSYHIVGSGDSGGVVTHGGYSASSRITIYRTVPLTQLLDLVYNTKIPSAQMESALDKITFALQQLAGNSAEGDRSIRFPFTEPLGNDTTLPIPSQRKDTVIFFNETTGEMTTLPMDLLAQRLLVILGAENVLPYRVREITGNYTVLPTDSNVFFRVNSASPVVITLPTTGGFNQAFSCEFSRVGNGSVTFALAGGVLLDSMMGANRIFGQYTAAALRAIGVNRWTLYGDIY